MSEKNNLLRTLDQAIELVRREPGEVAAFTFHLADLEAMRAALRRPAPSASQCPHRIADARNPVVKDGYICVDCGALFSAADHDDEPRESPAEYIEQLERETKFAKDTLEATRAAARQSASPAALTDEPTHDQLRAIARDARNTVGPSDDPGSVAYVLAGWKAARALLAASPADQGEDARDAVPAEWRGLRKAAKDFYNATVGEPALRLSSSSKQIRDEAQSAGEALRSALLITADAAMSASKEGA